MLNFVIAIMSSTFSHFDEVSGGLYLSTLIDTFPYMEWNDEFGSIVCINSTLSYFHLISLPLYFMVDLCCPKYLKNLNMFMSYFIFMPIVILIWIAIMSLDLLLMPVAYFVQLWRLFKSFFSAKVKRFNKFLSFI